MKRTVIAWAVVAFGTAPAVANRCYWLRGQIHCAPFCFVTDRWFDGSREWMRYWCAPPDLVFAAAVVAVVVLILSIAGAIALSRKPFADDITKSDSQAAEALRIAERLQAAQREADRFLETYRR